MFSEAVYVIPGLMGSTVWLNDHTAGTSNGTRIWVDYSRSYLHGLGELINPHPVPLVFDGIYKDYNPLLKHLKEVYVGTREIKAWAWDWTQSAKLAGVRLADELWQNRASYPGGYRLIGHSAGGMVAVSAWMYLKLGTGLVPPGSQSIINRIITLGSPLRGSYEWPLFGIERQDAIPLVGLLTWPTGGADRVFEIARTWIAPAETFPLAAGLDYGQADPHRDRMFLEATWQYSRAAFPQDLLDYVKNDWQPWITSEANRPPASVLTCVVSTGISPTLVATILPRYERTRASIRDIWIRAAGTPQGDRDRLPSFASSSHGDNAVPNEGAFLPGARIFEITEEHTPMVKTATILGNIAGWLDELPPAPPKPDPEPVPETLMPHGLDPAAPLALFNPVPAVRPLEPGIPRIGAHC